MSTLLQTLGDPVRLRLIRQLPLDEAAQVSVHELAQSLGMSDAAVSQHLRVLTAQGLTGHHRSGRSAYYYVKIEALAAARRMLARELPGIFASESPGSRLSARNQLVGRVVDLCRGAVSTEVVIDIGGQTVAAVITTASADSMDLGVGDVATAIFKAHDVIVQK